MDRKWEMITFFLVGAFLIFLIVFNLNQGYIERNSIIGLALKMTQNKIYSTTASGSGTNCCIRDDGCQEFNGDPYTNCQNTLHGLLAKEGLCSNYGACNTVCCYLPDGRCLGVMNNLQCSMKGFTPGNAGVSGIMGPCPSGCYK